MDNYPIRKKLISNLQHTIENSNKSLNITIQGKSGTGKTFFTLETLEKYFYEKNDFTIIYMNLIDDILSSSSFWDAIIFLTWNGDINDFKSTIKVSYKNSFSKYVEHKNRSKKVLKTLFQSVTSTVAAIPFYNAELELGGIDISNISNNNSIDVELQKGEWVLKYFKYLAKKTKLFLVLDNYQFMNNNIRLFFETGINKIKNNIVFINIQRTDDFEFFLPISYKNNCRNIEITNISEHELYDVFYHKFGNISILKEAVNDCFETTHGNLKEIDLYVRKNSHLIQQGILKKSFSKPLSNELQTLPPIQRDLVLLATMFPAGIRLEYVTSLMKNSFVLEDTILFNELEKIITLGYVMINSHRNDLLKLSHDKIGLSISPIDSTEEFIEFYKNIEDGLEEIILKKKGKPDYIYLLHCYIGICDSNRLIKSITFLEELIAIKSKDCIYYYLVELANEYLKNDKNVLNHLNDDSLILLLDACQKTCSFDTSISIIDNLDTSKKESEKYKLYLIKVLTQLYKFDKAMNEVKNIRKSNESILYNLIILEHLGKDNMVQNILNDLLESKDTILDKWFFLILRNTAHYFDYQTAENNLLRCLEYFKKCGNPFELATIHNNLSVIQIWKGEEKYSEAEKNIKKAQKILKNIGSNEIFEPYYNYGTLYFMKKQYRKALKYYKLSLEEVPETLAMDVTLLQLNIKLCKFALKQIKYQSLEVFLYNCLNNEKILQDPWVRFQIEYNLKNLELMFKKNTYIHPNPYYLHKENNHTDMTVFTTIEYDESKLDLCLSLSPNWRY